MYLKSDKVSRPVAGSHVSRRSIATQLAWFYALASSLMLILASGFLYWALVTTLEKEDESFLTNRANELRVILQEQPEDTKSLEREVVRENAELASYQPKTYSRILDESGRMMYETPGMGREIPPTVFPTIVTTVNTLQNWRSANGKSYRLVTTQTNSGATAYPKRQIQVALDETGEDALISRYGRYLMGVLSIGILMSAVIGIIAARRGMRPLADIIMAAERITANHLHERIHASEWPQELVSLASAFDGMLDRLEASFMRLSQFSADLAHELRAPINNLRGEAEVALSKPRAIDEYRDILASSLEEYERLSRMTDSLLFLAKADNAQLTANLLSIEAGHEVQKIINFYEALAMEQRVQVACEGKETIHADPDLFQRVVSNLLANALHYTSHGGKITFSIRRAPNGKIEVSCCDTGTGIAAEHLPRIFDRFYRADPSRHSHPNGAGLGLAIVKSIMQLHQGDIAVHSVVGEGTSVDLIFPAA